MRIIDKVRAEEATNKAARDKEGFDPGAVIPGVQAQWIQPLVIPRQPGRLRQDQAEQQAGRRRRGQPAYSWILAWW